MRISTPLTLALCLAPLSAQKIGSVNRNAPRVTTSVTVSKTKAAEVTYWAISTAGGKTLKAMMNKDRGARIRNYFNNNAKENPIASLMIAANSEIQGKSLRRGAHDLRIHIDDDCNWSISLTHKSGEAEPVVLPLKPSSSQSSTDRLVINLVPGKDLESGTIALNFGSLAAKYHVKKVARKKDGE